MSRSRQREPAGRWSSAILVIVAAVIVVVGGLGLTYVIAGGSGSDGPAGPSAGERLDQAAAADDDVALPDYVLAAPLEVQVAYRFVVQRPDVMVWVPCYCGCGDHSGHLSARNCFVQEGSTPSDIRFDPHGAGCAMCVDIALDTRAMIEDGASLQDIRAYIDENYGWIGPGTDTPLPPA